jgi:hypothetical protein
MRRTLHHVLPLVTTLGTAALTAPVAWGQAANAGWGPGEAKERSVEPVVSGESDALPDGGYGRFAGDLDLGLMLGAEVAPETERASARFSLHYFSMAGLAVGYADALGSESPSARCLSLTVDLRPLFIPRWSNDLTRGPAFVDLLVDSFSIGAGVFWDQPPQRGFGSRRGFEGSVGLGIPLAARASGPWFEGRALARWPSMRGEASPRAEGAGLLLIGWHHLLETGIVRRRQVLYSAAR